MKLYIKNMVCVRCKLVVTAELDKLGIAYKNIGLGEVEILGDYSNEQYEELSHVLKSCGMELIVDKRTQLFEKIKTTIIELIHYSEKDIKINFSAYLSEKLNYDYSYLSSLFTEMHGETIERYIINQKIKQVKELLIHTELTLSEIAWKLHYSSVQHLSNQFKKVTGLTPTFFKNMRRNKVFENN